MIKVKVPATTANLGPGFDTLGMSLKLYNELELSTGSSGLKIEIVGNGSAELATDETNLVYQAVTKLLEQVGHPTENLELKLINQIPLARGLGSSAAAIIAGLLAANQLSGGQLTKQELLELAVEIEGHPDNVAPALFGGVAITTNNQQRIVHNKVAVPSELEVVVAIPDYQLKTSRAREVLPKRVDFEDAVFNISHTALLISGLLNNDYDLISEGLADRLHQPYRAKLIPGFEQILTEVSQISLGVTLSGSGPTVVAFTRDNGELIGQKMVDIFAEHGIDADYLLTTPTNDGAEIIDC